MKNITEYERKKLLEKRSVGHYCIHCKYKYKVGRTLYCRQRLSNRSPIGYKVIKAHDDACGLYEQKI